MDSGNDLTASVCDDGWHCNPDCPFLDSENNLCKQGNVKLDWYDYHIAACVTHPT